MQYGGYFVIEPNQLPYLGARGSMPKVWTDIIGTPIIKQDERYGIRIQGNVMIMNNIRDFEKDLSGLVFFNWGDS